jgi:hypothetical protein
VNKKFLIIFVVAVVAAAGFFVFKSQKKEKELETHRNQQYSRMIEVAKKSSIAGLSHMARALNKYREEKGSYPENLSDLYPDYIPVEAFIEEIQWYYEPRGSDFYLSKTYKSKNNKVLTVVIGPDLMVQKESRVASIDKPMKTAVPIAIKTMTPKPDASITLASKTDPKLSMEMDLTGNDKKRRQATETKSNISKASLAPQKSSFHEQETVSTESLSQKEQYVKRVKGNFLVWKNADGSLGFGNVQYPDAEKMTIYDKGTWLQVHYQKPNLEAAKADRQTRVKKAATIDRLATSYSSRYLVWKDPKGTVCLSNVQYPNDQDIQIHVEGSWQSARNQ